MIHSDWTIQILRVNLENVILKILPLFPDDYEANSFHMLTEIGEARSTDLNKDGCRPKLQNISRQFHRHSMKVLRISHISSPFSPDEGRI